MKEYDYEKVTDRNRCRFHHNKDHGPAFAGTETLLYSDYRRHHADQLASVLFAIREAAERFPDCDARIILTGSGAKPVAEAAGTPYIQEVVANSIALRRPTRLWEPPSSSADRMRRSFSVTYSPLTLEVGGSALLGKA